MFDIDFVVMWVDGSDPAWLKEKAKYSPATKDSQKNIVNRFRDWGLMKYWFRAVEAYAPWVRKVHFVTWGHLPPFLNTDCEKLHIVKHEDYIPKEALPTYSSRTIEMNLHRIPDLSEHFVLFNDDMFLGRPVSPSDFFDMKTGNPKLAFAEIPLRFIGPGRPWEIMTAVDIGLINKHFRKRDVSILQYPGKYISLRYPVATNIQNLVSKMIFPAYYAGLKVGHSPVGLMKTCYEEIWKEEPEVMYTTTMHRFRELSDINHWAVIMWELASGRFSPKGFVASYFDTNEKNVDEICRIIRTRTSETICINDPSDLIDYQPVADKIIQAFEDVFPEKSGFER